MEPTTFVIYRVDADWGEIFPIGVYFSYQKAYSDFLREIGKELFYNLVFGANTDSEGNFLLNTIGDEHNKVGIVNGKREHLEDIEESVITYEKFEQGLKELTFYAGENQIVLTETIIKS